MWVIREGNIFAEMLAPKFDGAKALAVRADTDADDGRVICGDCGERYGVGDSPFCKDRHGRVIPDKAFEPRFDDGLGEYVTGWGDVHKFKREKKLDYRDHPSPGDLSARRDRIEQQKAGR